MVAIGQLLRQKLPVGPHDVTLRWTNDFESTVGTFKRCPQIPANFAEILVERFAVEIPVSEDHPPKRSGLSLDEGEPVGIFARHHANVCLLGTPEGVKTFNF